MERLKWNFFLFLRFEIFTINLDLLQIKKRNTKIALSIKNNYFKSNS